MYFWLICCIYAASRFVTVARQGREYIQFQSVTVFQGDGKPNSKGRKQDRDHISKSVSHGSPTSRSLCLDNGDLAISFFV